MANTTTFKDTSALGGTTYYYVVTAVNAVGESAFSIEVSAAPTTPATTQLPTTTATTKAITTSEAATTTFPGMLIIIMAFSTLVLSIHRRKKV